MAKKYDYNSGGYMAKGSKPKVIYTQFEEEEFEYAKGGEAGRYKIIQDTEGHYQQGYYGVFDTKYNALIDLFEFKSEAQGYLKELKEKGFSNVDASKYNGQIQNYGDGGMMADGGEIRKIKGNNFSDQIENGRKFKELIQKVYDNQSGEHKYPLEFINAIARGRTIKIDFLSRLSVITPATSGLLVR